MQTTISNTLKNAKDIILYPDTKNPTLENFAEISRQNLLALFEDNFTAGNANIAASAKLSLEEFEGNKDHGMEHEFNVYKKSLEIADHIEKETWEKTDRQLLYIMVLAHDAARSIVYPDSQKSKAQEAKLRRQKRNDRNHEKYWRLIVKKRLYHLKKQGYTISPEDEAKLEDYLVNHDFFSEQLNGWRFKEPGSLEGQIVRLADRISVPLKDEIDRYWETGKSRQTPFFFKDTDEDIRMNFSFDKMWTYSSQGIMDEVMFFTWMLMITWEDFSHPTLGRLYEERAIQKKDAAQYIMEIAEKENTSPEDKEALRILLEKLWQKYNFCL